MLITDAIEKTKRNLQFNTRHKFYKKCIEIRKNYERLHTGEDLEVWLPRFELREDLQLYKQRKDLTIENITPTISPVVKQFYGVSRIEPKKNIVAKDDSKLKFILENEANYYNRRDVEYYMREVLDKRVMLDPNSFYLVRFDSFKDGEKPRCYPVLFPCDSVYDYVYTEWGLLDYAQICIESKVSKYDEQYKTKRDGTLKDYYIYVDGATIIFEEVSDLRANKITGESWKNQSNDKTYIVGSFPTKNPEIAIRRLGTQMHPKYPICICPLEPVIPLIRDAYRNKSEKDISYRHHVFPQRVMMDDACIGEIAIDESRRCIGGIIAGTKDTCSVCGGDGFRPHKSAQETIRFKRPSNREDFIPIDDMVKYIVQDFQAVEMLARDIERNEMLVEVAVFGAGISKRQNMQQTSNNNGNEQQTATGIVVQTEEKEMVLDDFGKMRAEWFIFTGKQIAYTFDTTADIVFKYSGRFVMETAEAAAQRLKFLLESGAGEILVLDAQKTLARIQFDNDEENMMRYLTQQKFMPFSGKSSSQISSLLGSESVTKSEKILYANFSKIFTEIEEKETIQFYLKDYKAQKVIVDKKIEEIAKVAESEIPKEMKGLERLTK